LIMPVGNREQDLIVVYASEAGFETEVVEPVNFVPMLPGVER
jgi:hypothetical protein